ncbi:MAG TPA: sodium:solute symporter, partial [Ferruginibacter sp.]|nr:sodium:solute symporter [Ferruginibacter sp.]
DHLPVGLIGILFAIIFLSAWGSIAAALNSLAACTVVDFHQRYLAGDKPVDAYRISQWYTLGWGMFCILVSMFAHNIGNSLIEAVNILGSLFYGVILGIFLVAFWIRQVKGKAVFLAALVSECIIIIIYQQNIVSFLWLNVIGAVLVLLLGVLFEIIFRVSGNATST